MAKIEMNGKSNRQAESRIPILSPSPLRRSGSLRLGTCPPIQEHNSDVFSRPKLSRHRSLQSLNTASSFNYEQDDDVDSVKSFSSTASVCSNISSQCDHAHAHFARNGTTYSGRCKRYVVHCSPHSTETDDYLTPTQRTNRTIRKLRNLLKDAQVELAEKDKEILRLTKEVVRLRLLKADSGPESNETDGEAKLETDDDHFTRSDQLTSSPHPRYCSSPPLAQSLSDSGHFEDLNSSKDISHNKVVESIQRRFEDEIRELKERHNDKVDSLLQRITDVNDRYYALKPLYEDCKEKVQELEKLNEELKNSSCQKSISKEMDNLIDNDKQRLTNSNHDTLEVGIAFFKNKENELKTVLSNYTNDKYEIKEKDNLTLTDGSSQTEDLKSKQLYNGHMEEKQSFHGICEQNNCSYKVENGELQLQIVAHIERIKELEEQERNDKDIYIQLYKKGIEAAKLLDNKDMESGQSQESENNLIPDLLQKFRIKQEELDNVKAMYRRLLETRKDQPKHDPEMTLQFLKSAFYYFLTDRENAQGHLSAIESILGFSDTEKINIEKAFLWR